MLILDRRAGESLIIGLDNEVKVIRIDRQSVRLGMDAPRNVPVDRKEIRAKRLLRMAKEANGDG